MAHIVILGAGLGGMPMAYEMKKLARPATRSRSSATGRISISFRPIPGSRSTGASASDIEFPAAPYLAKKNIDFIPVGAKRVHPDRTRSSSATGRRSNTTIW